MTDDTALPKPGAARRLAAVAAIVIVVFVLVTTVLAVLDRPLDVLVQLIVLVVAFFAVWEALTRKGAVRVVWVVVAAAAAVAVVAIQIAGGDGYVLSLLVRLSSWVSRWCWRATRWRATSARSRQMETPGKPVPAARHGVLIMNLKSGGGKAEKFRLVDECRARGIEPVVLQRGDDLLQLARDAIDRGADVVGMAGGDGSQALVASIAAERGVPMVVIPAGTRNHFALDIGLDREDVVGALDAYGEARERVIDLADVNGRIFVNNVSLGLYATIVQSPEYRDAKRETTLAALPEMLGPTSKPFDLRFTTPDGAGARGRARHPGVQRPLRHHRRGHHLAPAPRHGAARRLLARRAGRRLRDARHRGADDGHSRRCTRAISRGRRPPSRWTRTRRSPWAWTGRRSRWTRRWCSRRGQACCACGCRCKPSATRRPRGPRASRACSACGAWCSGGPCASTLPDEGAQSCGSSGGSRCRRPSGSWGPSGSSASTQRCGASSEPGSCASMSLSAGFIFAKKCSRSSSVSSP